MTRIPILRWLVQRRKPGQASRDRQDSLAMYNTYDARNYLCELLERARTGEVIVIARAGRPIARLVPYGASEEVRPGVIRAHLVVRDAP